MKAWSWVVVAAIGFGVMVLAYATRAQADPKAPWASGLIVIGPELPAELNQMGRATPVRLRLLPAIEQTEAILAVIARVAKEKADQLELQLRPKLIVLPLERAGIDALSLQSGRLPEAGRDEVLAGPRAGRKDQVTAGDRDLAVVGVLKPEFALLRDDYLVPPSDAANALFPAGGPTAHQATLVQLTAQEARDRGILRKLETSLAPPKYTLIMPAERLERGTYFLYLAGLAAFLLGGSGTLIGPFSQVSGMGTRDIARRRRRHVR